MPYKSEKIPISGTANDSRRKLSSEQKSAIIILSGGGYSQRKLAEMFHCSRRLVQHVISPQPRSKATVKPTAYWTEAKRKYRQRKQELYTTGQISQKQPRKRKP